MTKEVQISIKMEQDLRDQFMATAAFVHRPAAQVIRELMRLFIAKQKIPNAETIAAIESIERMEEVTSYSNTDDLYKSLGI